MTIENKKLFAATVQHWIVSTSILLTGMWALYTFVIINEDQINRKPYLSANINFDILSVSDREYLKVTVEIQNKGNDSIWIELKKFPLVVSKVNFTENNQLKINKIFT